jgi:lysozyme
MAATTTTTTTVTTTTNGVSNTVTTTNTSSGSSASSSASYWLISYTMQKGETVSGVCNTLGINFDTYSSLIKSVNGISSWNKVSAGKTIYLPTTTAPVSGTSCYAVMSHTIAKGETATSICKAYGTSYSAVQKLISGLNPNSNMNSLKAGATLLVPVPTVITSTTTASTTTSSSSTVVAGTNTTTTGTTNTNTNTGSTGSTTKTYKLSTGTVTDGTIGFTVNGKSVTTAAAGSKVHITVTPGSYKALSSLTLTRADGSKATTISDGEFTMPESDVTVSATFSSGRYIGTSSNGGTVQLTLNGVEVSHAVKGARFRSM